MDRPGSETEASARQPQRVLRSLEGELLLLIAAQARRVPLQVITTAGAVALLVASYTVWIYPGVWFLLVCGSTWMHHRLVTRLPDNERYSEDRRLTLAAWSFGLHGLLLVAALAAFPYVPVTIGAVLSIYSIGLCASTLHATMGFRRIYLPYCLICMVPIGACWGLTPQLPVTVFQRLLFIGMTIAFTTTMLGHARGTWHLFADAHRMRRERLGLNRQLSEALVKAESASRAKPRFLASASHDLRQPIHALSLFSGSLAMRPLDARTAGIAEQIDKAVGVLGSQLDALLDISRLDAGVVETRLAVIDLRLLLQQMRDEFLPMAIKKGLALQVRAVPDLQVDTDPVLLQRILRNLLTNAIKYTDSGYVRLTAEPFERRCRIRVQDSGPGIPESERQRVFEEFYQLHNPERDRSKGLGLGLAIVSRLSDLLGIALSLDSRVGEGSCFTLELPLSSESQALVAEPHVLSEVLVPSGLEILVVDDEETIRLGMKTLLEEMGFRVELAASTEGALQVVQWFTPAIVLADFRLHGDDNGMRVIDLLRQRWPDLPALLISGDTAPDRLKKAHGAGIELLHKPVSAALLRQSILNAVDA